MGRIRNQKQGSSTKLLHRRKQAVKVNPAVDSSDEENLVTEAQETNDVRLRACIYHRHRFPSSGLVK